MAEGRAVNLQPFLIGEGWIEVLDGNDTVRAIFDRHYSRRRYADGRKPKLFIGPGEKLVLMTADAGAICAWRRERHRFDGQRGIECVIYRRESGDLASTMLAAARACASARFGPDRMFTFVDPRAVTPTMVRGKPVWGFCFYKDGWRFAGLTKKGLHILERGPA